MTWAAWQSRLNAYTDWLEEQGHAAHVVIRWRLLITSELSEHCTERLIRMTELRDWTRLLCDTMVETEKRWQE